MPYFLIFLTRTQPGDVPAAVERVHAGFIDGLIERGVVLTGGGFPDGPDDLYGAYVLRAASREEAKTLAQADPLVREGVVTCRALRWSLVAVDPTAADHSLLVTRD